MLWRKKESVDKKYVYVGDMRHSFQIIVGKCVLVTFELIAGAQPR